MHPFSGSEFADLYQRVEELKLKAGDPYAKQFKRSHTLWEVNETFLDAAEFENETRDLQVCGRVMSIDNYKDGVLIEIEDQDSQFQLVITPNNVPKASISLLKTNVFKGDYLGFTLNRVLPILGKLSGMVTAWCFLSVANLPIPKTMDLQRQHKERHLYWASNINARERLVKRSRMLTQIRMFLQSNDILEVNTSTIDSDKTPQQPVKNDLQYFMVGGIDQVYEIRPSHQPEPIDWQNHPQALWLYGALALKTLPDAMQLIEELVIQVTKYLHCAEGVLVMPFERLNATEIEIETVFGEVSQLEIDLSPNWVCRTVPELILAILGLDFGVIASVEEAKELVMHAGLRLNNATAWQSAQDVMLAVFKQLVTPLLIQPTFVLLPAEDERSSRYFELVINGIHIGSGYSEITDPMALSEDDPFSEQLRRALMVGMPPTTSFSLHLDRLALLMLGAMDVRDVICFPTP